MHDFLLVRSQSVENCVDLLWVAAELTEVFDQAQVDIAVPEDYTDYMNISDVVRRVISVPPPDTSTLASLAEKKNDSWRDTIFSAAKKITATASKNARAYWTLAEELRLLHYDAVFEFDSNMFGIGVTRLAKTEKIIGFDERNIDSPATGAKLMYHETYHIPGHMSHSMRLRQLAGRHFNYSPIPRDNKISRQAPPENTPKTPYIVIGGNIPKVFLQTVYSGGISIAGNAENAPINAKDMSAANLVGLIQNAAAVFGNGPVTAIAALTGKPTWFIGNERDLPEKADYISTPTILKEAMQKLSVASLPADNTGNGDDDAIATSKSQNANLPPLKLKRD